MKTRNFEALWKTNQADVEELLYFFLFTHVSRSETSFAVRVRLTLMIRGASTRRADLKIPHLFFLHAQT